MICKLDKNGKCHLRFGDQTILRHFQFGAVGKAMPSADTVWVGVTGGADRRCVDLITMFHHKHVSLI